MSDSSVGEEIYSGAASFGRVWTLIGAIFATLMGIVLVGIGIYTLTRKIVNKDKVQATVLRDTDCKSDTTNCVLNVSYTYKGKNYQSVFIKFSGLVQYISGQTVDIYINPEDISDITLNEPLPKSAGYVFIGIGILITLIAWIWYWLASKFKFVGAAAGIGGVLNIATGGRL